jgi:hypothetical protein
LNLDILWGAVWILGIIYFTIEYIIVLARRIKVKLKIKTICESIIDVKITNKHFVEGYPLWSTLGQGKLLMFTRIDSYLVEFYYNDINHTINSKDAFEAFDIGDIVKVKLIENLDKNNSIISYKIIIP